MFKNVWCWFPLPTSFCCVCKYELPIINRLVIKKLAGNNIVCWVQSETIYPWLGYVIELSCVSNTLQNFKSHFDMLSLIKPRSSIILYKGSEVDLAASSYSLHSCYLFIYLLLFIRELQWAVEEEENEKVKTRMRMDSQETKSSTGEQSCFYFT